MKKYKCTITSGSGTKTDGGDFEIKETPKTLTFICVRNPFFSNRMSEKILRINKFYRSDKKPAWRILDTESSLPYIAYMNNGHVARFWRDGDITVYPDQCGIPHYMEPI